MSLLEIRTVFFSVADTWGLTDFAQFMVDAGATVVSHGPNLAELQKAGVPVTPLNTFISVAPGTHESMHMLQPGMYDAIIQRGYGDSIRMDAESSTGIVHFDMVCVDLFNYAEMRLMRLHEVLEEIDVGITALMRLAAKHFETTVVVPATWCYSRIRRDMEANGMKVSMPLRRELAVAAYSATATHDAMIADRLRRASR